MQVAIIDNPNHFPQFEAQNVFQTEEYMRLFEHEKGTKVVLFVVNKNILQETNKECSAQNCSPELGELLEAEGSVNSQLSILSPKAQRPSVLNSQLVLVQPLTIHRYYRYLPGKFASYAVAWREPWRNPEISDAEAQKAFVLLTQAIEQYCRPRALYLEYRHFPDNNIYHDILSCYYKSEEKKRTQSKRRLSTFNYQLSTFKFLPWYNIYRRFDSNADVIGLMNKTKQRQLRQSLATGVQIEHNPTDEQIVEWYALLKRLYRRIHRPLPSLQLFQRLNQSSIGKLIIITYQGRVISGSAMLVFKQNNSPLSTLTTQFIYEYYRASTPDKLSGIYPSVVATWQELQFAADQGALFDFMGAGPQNKPYGVRDFKLTFGGELTKEYRYRKYLLF